MVERVGCVTSVENIARSPSPKTKHKCACSFQQTFFFFPKNSNAVDIVLCFAVPILYYCTISTETDRGREGERERERQTDRQTDRDTDRQTDRDRDRETDRQTDRQRQRDRQTNRQTDRDKETDRQ